MNTVSPNSMEPVKSYKSAAGFLMEKADDAILQTVHVFMLLITNIHAAFRVCFTSDVPPHMLHSTANPQSHEWEILILQVTASHWR